MNLTNNGLNCINCHHRHPENGNCTAVGGFCTSVPAAYCSLIPELVARAETAEARAEKAERERDEYKADIEFLQKACHNLSLDLDSAKEEKAWSD